MDLAADPRLLFAAGAAVVGGLVLLVRGFGAHLAGTEIADTAVSRIGSVAAGEVVVSGVVEAAETTLVSALQSAPAVFVRSRVDVASGDESRTAFEEERAVGFLVRDDSGTIRVFPRGATFDVPDRFDARSGAFGESPPGLHPRNGSVYGAGSDREAQVAALLTVRTDAGGGALAALGGGSGLGFGGLGGGDGGRRRYVEARLEPGDVVTVLGRALPFGELPDPLGADDLIGPAHAIADPEIALDLAEARAAGILEDTPEEAWGNAAIPGFGIGRPVRPPELDPAAHRPALATPEEAATAEARFTIPPDALVLGSTGEGPFVVALGPPAATVGRRRGEFLLGLLGAVVAIAGALGLAWLLPDLLG